MSASEGAAFGVAPASRSSAGAEEAVDASNTFGGSESTSISCVGTCTQTICVNDTPAPPDGQMVQDDSTVRRCKHLGDCGRGHHELAGSNKRGTEAHGERCALRLGGCLRSHATMVLRTSLRNRYRNARSGLITSLLVDVSTALTGESWQITALRTCAAAVTTRLWLPACLAVPAWRPERTRRRFVADARTSASVALMLEANMIAQPVNSLLPIWFWCLLR